MFFGGGIDHVVKAWGRRYAIAWTASAGRSKTSAAIMWYFRMAASDHLRTEVDGWHDAGGTHVSLVTMGLSLGSADGHIDYLASVAAALGLTDGRTVVT